jgi:hypothetical protein
MTSVMEKLLAFCAALNERSAHYELLVVRPEAVMVLLSVPGERWEIEFFPDGHIELERFVSQDDVVDAGPADLDAALRYFDSE